MSSQPQPSEEMVDDDRVEEGAAGLSARVSATDQASLSLVALRDVAIVAALLSLFAGAQAWATISGLALATGVSVVNGFLVGLAVAALAHEWGHFAGARLGGGHAPLKPIKGFLPLFDFDYANNETRAFDWMSIGGNIGHFAVVLIFFTALPMNSGGTTALVAGSFGFAVFSSAVELPVIQASRRGASGLEALGTIPKDFVRRYMPWAIGSALVAFVLL